jgi:hypothetical protein
METVIAVGLLAIIASSTLYAMVSSNRFAVTQRYVSTAKAICQERIDEALTRPFTSTTVPPFFGTWPLPAAETNTSTESVPIYTMADSGATQLVTGTRNTYVKWITVGGASFASVRVRVEFWVNGRGLNNKLQAPGNGFFSQMTTLRSPD